MKKILISLFILMALGGVFFYLYGRLRSHNPNFSKTVKYTLNGKTYHFLVATNAPEWEKGLMYYTKLTNADGMLFIFPDRRFRTFWNKNTYMDLDVYWLDGSRVVTKDFLPSIRKSKGLVIISSPEPVNKVIEIPR